MWCAKRVVDFVTIIHYSAVQAQQPDGLAYRKPLVSEKLQHILLKLLQFSVFAETKYQYRHRFDFALGEERHPGNGLETPEDSLTLYGLASALAILYIEFGVRYGSLRKGV